MNFSPSFLFDCFLMLANGWVLFRALGYLIRIKKGHPQRFLLFCSCSMIGAMVIFIGDAFNILASIPVFLAAVFFSCEGSLWKKITIGAMYASTIFSFNALRDNYLIAVILLRAPYLLLLTEEYSVISVTIYQQRIRSLSVISSLLFALLLYLGIRKYAPDKDYTLSDSLWRLLFLLTVTPFGIVLSLTTLFDFDRTHSEALAGYPAECFALLLIALFSFISLLWCITVLARQQKLEQQNMFTEINRRYYASMEQQHFEIRRLKHDLANHLQTLSALPEEKRDAYLKDLTENSAVSETLSYCGDATVNAVLAVKKNRMERYGIRPEITVDIPATLPFQKTDLCALYANALDNAIEACMQTDAAKRSITLKSKAQKGLLCLEVKNPLPEALSPLLHSRTKTDSIMSGKNASILLGKSASILPTSKPDKVNHGIGLRSIREIVDRYHGLLEVKTADGMFDLFLYLPLPAEQAVNK